MHAGLFGVAKLVTLQVETILVTVITTMPNHAYANEFTTVAFTIMSTPVKKKSNEN